LHVEGIMSECEPTCCMVNSSLIFLLETDLYISFPSIMVKIAVKIAYCILASSFGYSLDETSLLQSKSLKQVLQAKNRSCTLPGSHCVVSGDPHVKPFDEGGEKEMCLGPMGDYELVKTESLYIHARVMGYERDGGYAFVRGLVLGGARFGGKKFSVPILNAEKADGTRIPVEYDGAPIPVDGIEIEFPQLSSQQLSCNQIDPRVTDDYCNSNCNHNPSFCPADMCKCHASGSGSLGLRIWRSEGPKLVGFEAEDITDTTWKDTYWVELKKDGVVDVLIVINQGHDQHIMISATRAALKGTQGQCGNYNDVGTDDTIDVDDCKGRTDTCEFPVCPNPEDGKPRVPVECTAGSDQFEFYTEVCKAYWGDEVKTKEWKLFNCITDCCGDRDSCPDMGNEGLFGTCLAKGDPHIKTFDSPTVHKHVYTPLNDYWLVDSKFIQIQARYGSNRWDGKAQIMGVAVGGILTGGVTVYIPKGIDHPQIDGVTTESDYGTVAFELKYEELGENLKFKLDSKKAGKGKPLYTLTFKNPSSGKSIGSLLVNKNKNAARNTAQNLFFRVENWALDGVSGQCGNFNGNNTDDDDGNTVDLVAEADSMFPDTNPDVGANFNHKECNGAQAKAAKECCKAKHSPTTLDVINSCIVDHCCGEESGCDPATHCNEAASSLLLPYEFYYGLELPSSAGKTAILDDGSGFGPKSSGMQYGWTCDGHPIDFSAHRRATNRAGGLGLNHFGYDAAKCNNQESNWEISVPNGKYVVEVAFIEEKTAGCKVEGKLVCGKTGPCQPTVTSIVTDGRFTVTGLPGWQCHSLSKFKILSYSPDTL